MGMNPMFSDDKDTIEPTTSITKDKSMVLRLKQLEMSCERKIQQVKQESERKIKESEKQRQKDKQESEQKIKESERQRQKEKQESERRVERLENEVESLRKLVLQIMGDENETQERNESTIPAPWIACLDENEETYYYNKETQVVQWEKPDS